MSVKKLGDTNVSGLALQILIEYYSYEDYRSFVYVLFLILIFILYITRPHKHFALKFLLYLNKGCDDDDDDDQCGSEA